MLPLARTVSLTCPEPVTLVAFRNGVNPDGADPEKATVPLKPFNAPIVMVDVRLVPTTIVKDDGLADRAKSVTWTVTIAVWVRSPLAPTTST